MLQIVSDVAGVEQVIPALTIGASYGDAYWQGWQPAFCNGQT